MCVANAELYKFTQKFSIYTQTNKNNWQRGQGQAKESRMFGVLYAKRA